MKLLQLASLTVVRWAWLRGARETASYLTVKLQEKAHFQPAFNRPPLHHRRARVC